MGSTILNLLSENDNTDGSGIFDPRAYIFYETNNLDEMGSLSASTACGHRAFRWQSPMGQAQG